MLRPPLLSARFTAEYPPFLFFLLHDWLSALSAPVFIKGGIII